MEQKGEGRRLSEQRSQRFHGRWLEDRWGNPRTYKGKYREEERRRREEDGWEIVACRTGGHEGCQFDRSILKIEEEKGEDMRITVTTGDKRSFIRVPSAACNSFTDMPEQPLNARSKTTITKELWWRDSQFVITVFQSWRRECKIAQFRDKQVLARTYLSELGHEKSPWAFLFEAFQRRREKSKSPEPVGGYSRS